MIDFKRILCPVDTSEFSERALRFAAALSRWYGADLTVLSVRPLALPPALWMEYPVGPLLEPRDLTAEEERVRAFIQTVAGPSSAKVAVRDGSVRLFGEPDLVQALPTWFRAPDQEATTEAPTVELAIV